MSGSVSTGLIAVEVGKAKKQTDRGDAERLDDTGAAASGRIAESAGARVISLRAPSAAIEPGRALPDVSKEDRPLSPVPGPPRPSDPERPRPMSATMSVTHQGDEQDAGSVPFARNSKIAPEAVADPEPPTSVGEGRPLVLVGDSGTRGSRLLTAIGTAIAETGLSLRRGTTSALVNELAEAGSNRHPSSVIAHRITARCIPLQADTDPCGHRVTKSECRSGTHR
ncbi:hypothetical protein [Streptomyces sp. NBC_01264]|uniref:hypothetical protein n=1 Tax=Streptomyces sp. NBC_01264 TaxID=2903804 RepID=UPI002258D241|nr:hypothetical protein [Streptomyces sp. NBC_01264]MCX4781673.1 hypothetical protein [Streptomyces sp. NBC_01264]